jgi:hypothetical protein
MLGALESFTMIEKINEAGCINYNKKEVMEKRYIHGS